MFRCYFEFKNQGKDFNLSFRRERILLESQTIKELVAWCQIEDSCFPPDPQMQTIPRISFILDLKNTTLVLPNSRSANLVVAKGDMWFTYARKQILQSAARLENPLQMTATTDNLEFFRCDLADIEKAPSLEQLKKRNMILPLTCTWALHYAIENLSTHHNQIICTAVNELSLDQALIYLSYTDLMVLQDVIQTQLEILDQAGLQPKPEEPSSATIEMKPENELQIKNYSKLSQPVPATLYCTWRGSAVAGLLLRCLLLYFCY